MIYKKNCASVEDFIAMYLDNSGEGASKNPFRKSTLRKLAAEEWNLLYKRESEFFDRHKYIGVVFSPETKTYSIKKTRGRPKADKAKVCKLTIRLNEEQMELIDNFCRARNVSDRSTVIREAIDRYFDNSTELT